MPLGFEHLTEQDRALLVDCIAHNQPPDSPFHLELYPSNRCNANCFFCSTRHHRHAQVMPWPLLEKTLTEAAAANLRSVRLAGGGEPLVYSEIDPLLDFLAERHISVSDIITNGILLEKYGPRICRLGTQIFCVSLNEPTAESYSHVMNIAPKNFDRILEGVRATCAERDKMRAEGLRPPVVQLQLFFWRENYHLAREMYELGVSLGVDRIFIKTLTAVPHAAHLTEDQFREARELLGDIIREDCETGRYQLTFDMSQEGDLNHFVLNEQKRQMPPEVNHNPSFDAHSPRHEYCILGWLSAVVAATGVVYPCCILEECEGKALGSLHDSSLKEIWNGKRFQRFRQEFRTLMCLRGRDTHSPRRHQILEPQCLQNFGCYYTFQTATPDFYADLSQRLEGAIPSGERFAARLRHDAFVVGKAVKKWLP